MDEVRLKIRGILDNIKETYTCKLIDGQWVITIDVTQAENQIMDVIDEIVKGVA